MEVSGGWCFSGTVTVSERGQIVFPVEAGPKNWINPIIMIYFLDYWNFRVLQITGRFTMNYYDDPNNVQDYIKMAEGYDGRELVEVLIKYLPEAAAILELGMGPGVGLDLLSQYYRVTGSDNSQIFLDRYREKNEAADLLLLDARTLQTSRSFDGIYSNKVLHHLSEEELKESFLKQKDILLPQGIAFHSFWLGDREEFMEGLRFRYYSENLLISMVDSHFEVLEAAQYAEFEAGDSLYLVHKKA